MFPLFRVFLPILQDNLLGLKKGPSNRRKNSNALNNDETPPTNNNRSRASGGVREAANDNSIRRKRAD